jgi:CRP-like cAMP-binding protein
LGKLSRASGSRGKLAVIVRVTPHKDKNMTELYDFIKSQINIDENELQTILSNFNELKIAKDKFVLKQGHFATDYYFIKSGGLRIGFDKNDSSKTAWVALENEFFTDLTSIKNKVPSKYNIQAMEDTVLFTIKSETMNQLYKEFPVWQQFGRQIWENAFLKVVDGLLSFQNMNAEERYMSTMQQTDLLQRIPLKDLASFLGITQTSLSRLRKNIK